MSHPPSPTTIPCCWPSSLSSPQSVYQYCDEIPLSLSSFYPPPPMFCSRICAPPGLPPNTLHHSVLLVPPYIPAPFPPSPISSDLSVGFYKAPPSHCYCTRLCALGKLMMWLPWVGLYWPWFTPYFLWSSDAISIAVFGVPVPSVTLWCCSSDFSDAMVSLVICSARNVVMALGVLRLLFYCPPYRARE